MKHAYKRIAALALLLALAVVSHAGQVLALSEINISSLPQADANDTKIKAILTIVFGIVGALSLLALTIGGFKYIASQGDSQAVAKAKNTIIYALVGMLVAILATAIVTFVLGSLG